MAWMERVYGAQVSWQPFDLHPEYPAEGKPTSEVDCWLTKGFGDNVAELLRMARLPYKPPEYAMSSMEAMEMAELARERGCFPQVHVELSVAYWSEGRDLADRATLIEIGSAAGMDPGEISEALGSGRHRQRVADSTAEAREIGADGLPAFVIDGKVLLIGAHPHEVFDEAMASLGHRPVEAA